MRLIDADELREKCDAPYWCVWLSDIDNAPTIEPKQGEWVDKAISIIDDMRSEGIVDYEQAREFRMRARMKGADNE